MSLEQVITIISVVFAAVFGFLLKWKKIPVAQVAQGADAGFPCINHVIEIEKNVEKIKEKTEELHKMHDKEDDYGVKVWYVYPLKESIDLMTKEIKCMNKINASMTLALKEIAQQRSVQ
jgi:hypothetical protein